MNAISSSKSFILAVLFISSISIHLIAEAVRRFLIYSNSVYLLADIALIITAIFSAKIGSFRFDRDVACLLTGFLVFGIVSSLVAQEHPALILVGIRPLVLALAAFVVAENLYRYHPRADVIFIHTIGVWSIIILIAGILQISSGIDAPINILPSDPNNEFGGGRGDYAGEGGIIEWIFRPTSIFMHTGRLGQYSFFLSLSLCLTLLLSSYASNLLRMYVLFSIMLVVISGQRAAGVFLIASCLSTVAFFGSRREILRLLSLFLGIALAFLLATNDLINVIFDRFSSGFTDGSNRVFDMTRHWDVGFLKFLFFGHGLGFFSFGSSEYGGAIYYEYMARLGGGGENSWLRIQGETGIPGLLFFISTILVIIIKSYKRSRLAVASRRLIHLICIFFSLSACAWAFTHDVFGNYLYTMGIFFLFGASSGLSRIRYLPIINSRPIGLRS